MFLLLNMQTFVDKVMFLLLNMFIIAFLPRSKCPLISWLQLLSTVILEPKKIKYATAYMFSPSACHEVIGQHAMILVFWMLSFKPAFFHSSLSPLSRGSLVPLHFLPLQWYHLHIWASLVAQFVKNLPATWETWVWFLGWEDLLEKGMTTHSSILAWRIPMDRGAWWTIVHGVAKSQHNWETKHSTSWEMVQEALSFWRSLVPIDKAHGRKFDFV